MWCWTWFAVHAIGRKLCLCVNTLCALVCVKFEQDLQTVWQYCLQPFTTRTIIFFEHSPQKVEFILGHNSYHFYKIRTRGNIHVSVKVCPFIHTCTAPRCWIQGRGQRGWGSTPSDISTCSPSPLSSYYTTHLPFCQFLTTLLDLLFTFIQHAHSIVFLFASAH